MSYVVQELCHEIGELKKALAEKERETQQIREHEYQRGYQDGEAVMLAQAVRFATPSFPEGASMMTRDTLAHYLALISSAAYTQAYIERVLDHDAEQRAEIERLQEALEAIVKIRFLLGNDPKLNPAYEMGDIAKQAMRESTK